MFEPLGYLLTWTCYGTWLHGDVRCSVDAEHNMYETPYLPPDPEHTARQRLQLKHPPAQLDANARSIVAAAIEAHCSHRGWALLAVNVRSNHVHTVVAYPGVTPERVLVQLKAWTTRRLRQDGVLTADARVWTHHGSTRYLWNKRSLDAATAYVAEGQGPDLD